MTARDRLHSEQLFHDQQARMRAADLASLDSLVFDDNFFLDHETWIRPAFQALGPMNGRRALDYGCGHGMAAVVMARHGAIVSGFDLSPGYLAEAGRRALANRVEVELLQADAEQLPFPDATFDRVWGNAILHHLDLPRAARELRRVMKPNGLAVFCEPWGDNPILDVARRWLPYPHKQRTPDEKPLCSRDLKFLRAVFPQLQLQGFQLLSMVRRLLPFPRMANGLDWCDRQLLRAWPSLAHFCRYVVLTLPQGEYNQDS